MVGYLVEVYKMAVFPPRTICAQRNNTMMRHNLQNKQKLNGEIRSK